MGVLVFGSGHHYRIHNCWPAFLLAISSFVTSTFAFMASSTTTSRGTAASLRRRNVHIRHPPPNNWDPDLLMGSSSSSSSDAPGLMLCSVIDSGDSSSEASAEGDSSSKTIKMAGRSGLFGIASNIPNLKSKMLQVSNWASLLCVLDCTILPIVTVVLPLLGLVSFSPRTMHWLHELGHQIALYFVLPVGGLATTLNYTNHKQKRITLVGWMGLFLVLSANIGCHHVHYSGPGQAILKSWLHLVHHGIQHRLCNLGGCALLLTSNYWSRQQPGTCHDPGCTVKHR